jgi:uncharacterized hydrophobic protein (TIGR00271 family)
MNPILSLGFSLVCIDIPLILRSLLAALAGIVITVAISFIVAVLLPINVVGSEVLSRATPNILDLVIALAAGTVGAFATSSKDISSSIAGVAIAVALVPPLCVVGLGLGIGDEIVADFGMGPIGRSGIVMGSFMFLFTNFVGIVFAAVIVFLCKGYGSIRKTVASIGMLLVSIVLASRPLSTSLRNLIVQHRVTEELRSVRLEVFGEKHPSQIRFLRVTVLGSKAHVEILTNASEGSLTDNYITAATNRIGRAISPLGINSVHISLRVENVRLRQAAFEK